MKFRIQTSQIEIPLGAPFANDLLDRKDQIEILTNVVVGIEGSATIAIDGPWGSGKTTFIRMWSQHLRNVGFPVVNFNAWETDYFDDPFIALSTELTEGLQPFEGGSASMQIESIKKASLEVARLAIPGLVRAATGGILDITPLLAKPPSNSVEFIAEGRRDAYVEAKRSLHGFRSGLCELAEALSTEQGESPLVIFIDELDRCRPVYAVELLEIAKHLFSVNRIIIVMAINKNELAHSVSALYGTRFDGNGYLSRFFDIDIRLANPDRSKLVKSKLNEIGFDEYLRIDGQKAQYESEDTAGELLTRFFSTPELSIRAIAQAMHRLELLLASLRPDRKAFGLGVIVSLIIRSLDIDLYERFLKKEVDDEGVVKAVFDLLGADASTNGYTEAIFEGIVIAGYWEMLAGPAGSRELLDSMSTPLLVCHDRIANDYNGDSGISSRGGYARFVAQYARNLAHNSPWHGIGFEESARRLELLSSDLSRI